MDILMTTGEINFADSTVAANISAELLPLLSPPHDGPASSEPGTNFFDQNFVEYARLIPGFQSFEELLRAEDVEMVTDHHTDGSWLMT